MKSAYLKYFTILLLAAVAFQGCSLFGRRYEKSINKVYTLNLADKDGIRFESLNGKVKLFPSDDSLAHLNVNGKYFVRRKDLDKSDDNFILKIDSSGKKIVITEESLREIGLSNFHFGPMGNITYELYVPGYKPLEVNNTNSNMEISGTAGDLNVSVTNGNIKVTNPKGNTVIKVTNGKLTGMIDSLKGFDADIINGKINLTVGKKFSGAVNCSTQNGSVKVSSGTFENVNMEKKNMFSGKTGTSESQLKLSVLNGSIRLSPEIQTDDDED
jgi:hypothetical protein